MATPAVLPQRCSRRLRGQAPLSPSSPTGGVVGSAATTPFGGKPPSGAPPHSNTGTTEITTARQINFFHYTHSEILSLFSKLIYGNIPSNSVSLGSQWCSVYIRALVHIQYVQLPGPLTILGSLACSIVPICLAMSVLPVPLSRDKHTHTHTHTHHNVVYFIHPPGGP